MILLSLEELHGLRWLVIGGFGQNVNVNGNVNIFRPFDSTFVGVFRLVWVKKLRRTKWRRKFLFVLVTW